MLVSVFEGDGEVLIFANNDGQAIGSEEYFEQADRSRDDYDVKIMELPLAISTRCQVEPSRFVN